MTIEELREMRGAIGTLAYLNGETASPYLMPNNGLCKSLLALIDAEIARQSVTDEDVERAIAVFEKADFERNFWPGVKNINLAIKALRAYKKATILHDRSDPDEPRRYCSNCKNELDYYGDFGEWVGCEENYCSECGAKLEGEL